MAVLQVGPGKTYSTLNAAIDASQNGDTILVQAGTYTNDFSTINDNIRIVGVGGMVNLVATEPIPNEKGILITDGNDTIVNVSFSGATVTSADGSNGAGIRYQAGNLILRNDDFHDNQDGLLANSDPTGTITISHTEFANNGAGDGLTHDLYVNDLAKLTVADSLFEGANVGHEIKSRATETVITRNRIYDLQSTASYNIDLPNGGVGIITDNVIEQGPNSQNAFMLAYGEEGNLPATNSLTISKNTILNDLNSPSAALLLNDTSVTPKIVSNQFYGLTASQGAPTGHGNSYLTSEPALDESPPFTTSTATAGTAGNTALMAQYAAGLDSNAPSASGAIVPEAKAETALLAASPH